jgi:hypothetical protein
MLRDDRRFGAQLARLRQQLAAGHFGHPHVGDHQVNYFTHFFDVRERLTAVGRDQGFIMSAPTARLFGGTWIAVLEGYRGESIRLEALRLFITSQF